MRRQAMEKGREAAAAPTASERTALEKAASGQAVLELRDVT